MPPIRLTVAEAQAFNALTKGQVSKLVSRMNKYGAKRTTIDGHTFDSAKEAKRFSELTLLARDGSVLWFVCQPTFYLQGGIKYRPDFLVVWVDGTVVIEEIKGGQATKTEGYRLKRRLLKALFPRVEVFEH